MGPSPASDEPEGSPVAGSETGSAVEGGEVGFVIHEVSKFDTLAGVAVKHNVSVSDIRRLNGLLSDSAMHAHGRLRIPTRPLPVGAELQAWAGLLVRGPDAIGGSAAAREQASAHLKVATMRAYLSRSSAGSGREEGAPGPWTRAAGGRDRGLGAVDACGLGPGSRTGSARAGGCASAAASDSDSEPEVDVHHLLLGGVGRSSRLRKGGARGEFELATMDSGDLRGGRGRGAETPGASTPPSPSSPRLPTAAELVEASLAGPLVPDLPCQEAWVPHGPGAALDDRIRRRKAADAGWGEGQVTHPRASSPAAPGGRAPPRRRANPAPTLTEAAGGSATDPGHWAPATWPSEAATPGSAGGRPREVATAPRPPRAAGAPPLDPASAALSSVKTSASKAAGAILGRFRRAASLDPVGPRAAPSSLPLHPRPASASAASPASPCAARRWPGPVRSHSDSRLKKAV